VGPKEALVGASTYKQRDRQLKCLISLRRRCRDFDTCQFLAFPLLRKLNSTLDDRLALPCVDAREDCPTGSRNADGSGDCCNSHHVE
jgi:hypothetical protein